MTVKFNLFSGMTPTAQNVESLETVTQTKMHLINKFEHIQNNNTISAQDYSDKINDMDFNITNYEAMEFRPQIKWPDLIVQVMLHLVTIYGCFLVLISEVRFLTILFGKYILIYFLALHCIPHTAR